VESEFAKVMGGPLPSPAAKPQVKVEASKPVIVAPQKLAEPIANASKIAIKAEPANATKAVVKAEPANATKAIVKAEPANATKAVVKAEPAANTTATVVQVDAIARITE